MTAVEIPKTIAPDLKFRKMFEETSEEKVSNCFQCGKCTLGCPLAFAMDIYPHKVIHLLQYGQADEILRSDTIWVCASCETCTTRCPNGIDIAHIMDSLRQLSQKQGIKAAQPSVPIFHSAFLKSIKRHGRVHELEMALTYSIQNTGLLGPLKMTSYGLAMFLKGKVKIFPSRVRGLKHIKNLFNKTEAS
ncbi:4Fe-4S dicluster domain-containing protein [Chloroflexota bacterium]